MLVRTSLACLALSTVSFAQIQRLSGPPSPTPNRGDVREFAVSEDGSTLVYVSDQRIDGVFELFAVPFVGGPTVRLSPELAADGEIERFKVSSDGSAVAFLARRPDDSVPNLFVSTTDGLSVVNVSQGIPISPAIGSANDFEFTPDGSQLVFRSDEASGRELLYRADLTLGAALTLVSAPDADVLTWAIGPDATGIAYTDRNVGIVLFGGPLSGSTPPVQLSQDLDETFFGVRSDFAFTPDGTRVVYAEDAVLNSSYEVWSVPVDGSAAPSILHPPGIAGASNFVFSDDGSTVYFSHGAFGVLASPVDGSGPATVLTPTHGGSLSLAAGGSWLVADLGGSAVPIAAIATDGSQVITELSTPGESTGDLRVTADGAFAVFRQSGTELYGRPVDGSGPLVQLSTNLASFQAPWLLTADGSHAVWYPWDGIASRLYVAPVDGSAPARPLYAAPGAPGDFQDSGDGSRIVFDGDLDVAGRFELYSVAIADPMDVVEHSAPQSPIGARDVVEAIVDEGASMALFVIDDGDEGLFSPNPGDLSLYAVPTDGSRAALLLAGPPEVPVQPALSPDGTLAAYWLVDSTGTGATLFAAATDGASAPVALAGHQNGGSSLAFTPFLTFTPDGTRLLYRTGTPVELRSVPTDGSAPPIGIAPSAQLSSFLRISPDGTRVVLEDGNRLVSAPVDAPGGAQPLSPFLSGADAIYAAFSPDSSWIVVTGKFAGTNAEDVFAAPADGSAMLTKLSPPGSGGDAGPFRITPDSQEVLFEQDDELYVVPIDGSAPAASLASSVQRVIDLSADGSLVTYAQAGGDVFVVPPDGSAPPTRIGQFGPFAGNLEPRFSPDGQFVAVRRGEDVFVLPLDGSASYEQTGLTGLSQTLVEYQLTGGGNRSAYVADQGALDRFALFVGATAEQNTGTPLIGAETEGGDVGTLTLERSRGLGDEVLRNAFFSPPLEERVAVSPDGSRVVVVGDVFLDNRFELLSLTVGPGVRRVRPSIVDATALEPVRFGGFGFVPGVEVRFGGVLATDVTYIDSTRIDVVPPPAPSPPPGKSFVSVPVTVSDGAVEVGVPVRFTYTFPLVPARPR